MRICSFLPGATEIVCVLGLGEQLVAVTHECDYPSAARRLPVVTLIDRIARIQNVLDEDYAEVRGFPALGITALAGIRASC